MKRFAAILMLAGIFCAQSLAATYYIPHIHTANNAWETYLLLSNASETLEGICTVELYDETGALLTTLPVTLNPGETATLSLRSYGGVTGTLDCAADYVSARLGYVASQSSGGGTAEFNLPVHLSNAAVLNLSGYSDQLTWSGFAVYNGTDEDVTVTPRYFTTDELSHAGTSFVLGARQKRVDYFESELGQPFTNLNSVVFETDSDALAAIVISGKENEKLLFTNSTSYSNSWDVVDVYPKPGLSHYEYVGQAATFNKIIYAVTTSDTDTAWRTKVVCFDKQTGERLWESDLTFTTAMTATQILVPPSGNYVYLCGGLGTDYEAHYRAVCLSATTGATVGTFTIDLPGLFTHTYQKRVLMAAGTSGCVFVAQRPDGITR